jgi:hypothetical protein
MSRTIKLKLIPYIELSLREFKCYKCKQIKKGTEFYPAKKGLGIGDKCKACDAIDGKKKLKFVCPECNQRTNKINQNGICIQCNENFGLRECIRCKELLFIINDYNRKKTICDSC